MFNPVKGGSAVPLKFNIAIDGVNQTSTSGLVLTTQVIACDASTPLGAEVPGAGTGETSLRYESLGGFFVANWKVPKTRGTCYMVRVTTQADGLALTAKFAVK